MANDLIHTDARRAATDVGYLSGDAFVQAVLEELQWQLALRDEATELRLRSDTGSIKEGIIWEPAKNKVARQSSQRSEENEKSTLREHLERHLRGKLGEMGIEEVSAIRVVFENGETVRISSQDDPALDRTDPIQKLTLLQSARAAALVGRLQKIKIKLYQEIGHKMPHVHIDYGREPHVASFSIETAERIIPGTLDRKYDSEIKGWLSKHKDKLLMVWREMQLGRGPKSLVAELRGDV